MVEYIVAGLVLLVLLWWWWWCWCWWAFPVEELVWSRPWRRLDGLLLGAWVLVVLESRLQSNLEKSGQLTTRSRRFWDEARWL